MTQPLKREKSGKELVLPMCVNKYKTGDAGAGSIRTVMAAIYECF